MAAPQTAYTARAGVAAVPACWRASTLKTHHTELPAPTSTAESRSGRDRGQKNQFGFSCGRRSVTSSRGGASVVAPMPATTAITTKPAQATRHWSPARMATGPASTTPHPVPELIVDHTTAWRGASTCRSTMSAYGGNAIPAAVPATSTPVATAQTLSATAMTAIPNAADAAAPATATRAPSLEASGTTAALATR